MPAEEYLLLAVAQDLLGWLLVGPLRGRGRIHCDQGVASTSRAPTVLSALASLHGERSVAWAVTDADQAELVRELGQLGPDGALRGRLHGRIPPHDAYLRIGACPAGVSALAQRRCWAMASHLKTRGAPAPARDADDEPAQAARGSAG